jgi:hypothetical protein
MMASVSVSIVEPSGPNTKEVVSYLIVNSVNGFDVCSAAPVTRDCQPFKQINQNLRTNFEISRI